MGNSPFQTSIKKEQSIVKKKKEKTSIFTFFIHASVQMGQGKMVPMSMPMIKLECDYTFAAITQHEYYHLKRSLKFQSTTWPYFLLWSYKTVNNG